MGADNPNTRTRLGFIFVFALLVVLLIATRGVMGGMYGYISDISWVAGILFLLFASATSLWIVFRYVGSYGEE